MWDPMKIQTLTDLNYLKNEGFVVDGGMGAGIVRFVTEEEYIGSIEIFGEGSFEIVNNLIESIDEEVLG